jgi:hypothetical protein
VTAPAAGPPAPLIPPGGNANHQGSNISARPASPRMFTIDVGRQVSEIERVLRAGGDLAERVDALAILERWQFDEMLDDESRTKARVLVREFAVDGSDDVRRR